MQRRFTNLRIANNHRRKNVETCKSHVSTTLNERLERHCFSFDNILRMSTVPRLSKFSMPEVLVPHIPIVPIEHVHPREKRSADTRPDFAPLGAPAEPLLIAQARFEFSREHLDVLSDVLQSLKDLGVTVDDPDELQQGELVVYGKGDHKVLSLTGPYYHVSLAIEEFRRRKIAVALSFNSSND